MIMGVLVVNLGCRGPNDPGMNVMVMTSICSYVGKFATNILAGSKSVSVAPFHFTTKLASHRIVTMGVAIGAPRWVGRTLHAIASYYPPVQFAATPSLSWACEPMFGLGGCNRNPECTIHPTSPAQLG